MALTTTTTLGTLVPTEYVEARILEEARPYNVVAPLVWNLIQPEGMGTVRQISQLPASTAASVDESSDIAAAARTTTSASITIGEVGLATEVTRFATEVSKAQDLDIWARNAGRAIAQKLTGDLCGLFAALNSGTAIGTSGTNIAVADFIEAVYTLENANAPGQPVCVLHPRQKADLASAIVAAGGTVFENLPELVRTGQLPAGVSGAGFWGVFLGVPIYATTEVATANSGADRAGAMFVREAIALVKQRPVTVEYDEDRSKRTTEVIVTTSYGVGEVVDSYGVPLVTDA
jgi:hypothetical protein